MLSDDLSSSLRAAPALRRRPGKGVWIGAATGIAIGLALAPWAVEAAQHNAPLTPDVSLSYAGPLGLLAFGALALATRRRAG
jgi:hypothetical protein